jgi:hypothetical protein
MRNIQSVGVEDARRPVFSAPATSRRRQVGEPRRSAESRFDIRLGFDEIRISLVTPTKPDDYVEGILEGTNDAYHIEC